MHRSPQPFPIALWNFFARRGAGSEPILAEEVIAAARKSTKLDDFGDDAFMPGLEAFLDSVAKTDGLHAFGRFYLWQLIKAMLVHRLKLTAFLAEHPDALQAEIRRPIFILGLPRSGTTLLFNLLAQDSSNRYMPNWESFIGQVPPQGNYTHATDPRRRGAKWMLRVSSLLMPELDQVHEFTPHGPEECTPILMQGFTTQAMAGNFDVPDYSLWLDEADRLPTYRHHRKVLQTLQWKYPAERWLLKSPDHIGALDALLAVYPDACCVHIHRDPAQSVSSWASLNKVYREVYYPELNLAELGEQVLSRLAADMAAYTAARETATTGSFFDVQYKELLKDPMATVVRIHEAFDMPLAEETRKKLQDWYTSNPQHKHGVHSYRPEDFGLTPEDIHERFSEYIEKFSVPLAAR